MGSNDEFGRFDRTMRKLIKVSHEELKAKLDAEKRAKEKKETSEKKIMTTEIQTFISLRDITGLRFECRQCGIKYALPFTEKSDVKAFAERYKCQHCGTQWFQGTQDQRYVSLISFLKYLLEAREKEKEFAFGLMLEVVNEEPEVIKKASGSHASGAKRHDSV